MIRALLKLVAVLAVVMALALSAAIRQLSYHLLFGWLAYLGRVLPEVNVRWDAVGIFLVGTAIFAIFVHRIATWLRREMSGHSAVWRWSSTMLVVGLLLMTFIAGIAMVGVTHQTAWLIAEDGRLLIDALPDSPSASRNNLREMDLAMRNFNDIYGQLPSRPSNTSEQVEHSWVSRIMPFLILQTDIDTKKPWDHPDNQPKIRKLVPMLLNPGLRPPVLRDANGYGVSHYAGNAHLFDHAEPLSLSDFSNGAANTLMIGEVHASFQPWAKPRANRDPALGINRSPDGFGGPAANGGALFLMVDGSVRFFSRDTDPNVLNALGTPKVDEPKDELPLKP